MTITNQEVLRRGVQLNKACLLAYIRNKKVGYFGHMIRTALYNMHYQKGNRRQTAGADQELRRWTIWHNGQDVAMRMDSTRKTHDRNYWRQPIECYPTRGGNGRQRYIDPHTKPTPRMGRVWHLQNGCRTPIDSDNSLRWNQQFRRMYGSCDMNTRETTRSVL